MVSIGRHGRAPRHGSSLSFGCGPTRLAKTRHFLMFRPRQVFDWLDGIEVTVCAFIAALLLVIGPLFVLAQFILRHHYLPAAMLGLLWCGCVVACICDLRRRSISWVTGGLLVAWVVLTLVVGMSLQ